MSGYHLVIAADEVGIFKPHLQNMVDLFSSVHYTSNVDDFRGATAAVADEKVVLACFGKISTEAIRFFCEQDADKPLLQHRRVQWIHSFMTGTDGYNFATLGKTIGCIPFSNARGVYADSLGEHIILSMLYFNRKVWQLQENQRNKVYDRFSHNRLLGATMGIVGYGNIGEQCAKRAASFGMNILGLRRSAPREGCSRDAFGVELLHGPDGLNRLLTQSDFVVNIMPATSENYHFFDAAVFKRMKRDAIYMNIGRGQTHAEADLVAALRENVIRGAAIDVFEKEPLPEESELWSIGSDKLLLTPHNADIHTECFEDATKHFVDLATSFVRQGELPKYLVDTAGKGY